MVRREGTRFGVSSGHCVRRPVKSQKTVHSSQNIVVEATTDVKIKRVQKQASSVVENHLQNRTLNLKGFGNETVLLFSLNKNKRWEVIDQLKKEAGTVCCHGNRIVVSEHHIGVGNPDDNDCTAVYDSMSAKSKCSPTKTYARASDLSIKETESSMDQTVAEDAEFGTKNRRRRQKKKVIVDKKTGIQEEVFAVSVSYSINVPAPKHTLYTYPKRVRSNRMDASSDENVVLQTTKQGTKKRNKKMSHDMLDDLVYVRDLDAVEDYYSEDEDDWEATDEARSIPRSEVTTVFGMFAAAVDQQIAKPVSKRNNHSIQGSCTKDRMFQIEEPDDEKSGGESSLDLEDNAIVNLVISAGNLLPEILKGEFGEDYREAYCSPRRFAVDITDRVINKVIWKCGCNSSDTLLSVGYQVFTIFSFPMQEACQHVDVSAKVVGERFNKMDAEKVLYGYRDEIRCLTDVVERIAKGLAYRVENRCQCEPNTCHRVTVRHLTDNSLSTVGGCLNWGIEVHSRRQIWKQILASGDEKCEEETSGGLMLCEDHEDTCRICYSNVSEMFPGTRLQTCNHLFCDDCWKGYLIAKVSQGDHHIACPEFNCKVPVDQVTLMSLVPYKLSFFHLQQKLNATVAANKHLQWCPNTGCGRVARVTDVTSNAVSIACECGFDWCSKCKQEAHWPATCVQIASYRSEKAAVLKYLNAENKSIVDHVRYKNCPKCSYPIEKIPGYCNVMMCACRCTFCWSCGRIYDDGHGKGYYCKQAPLETFEFDVPSLEHVYQLSVMHHFKRSRLNSTRRNLRANQLANKVVVAVALTHERSSEESIRRVPSFLSTTEDEHIPKPVAFSLLNSEEPTLLQDIKDLFRGASGFLLEAYSILEFLEILLESSPPCDLRKWLYQQKLRLEFISQQLDDILNLRMSDIKGCVDRVKTLHDNGKSCLAYMAKAASELSNMREVPINVGTKEP